MGFLQLSQSVLHPALKNRTLSGKQGSWGLLTNLWTLSLARLSSAEEEVSCPGSPPLVLPFWTQAGPWVRDLWWEELESSAAAVASQGAFGALMGSTRRWVAQAADSGSPADQAG